MEQRRKLRKIAYSTSGEVRVEVRDDSETGGYELCLWDEPPGLTDFPEDHDEEYSGYPIHYEFETLEDAFSWASKNADVPRGAWRDISWAEMVAEDIKRSNWFCSYFVDPNFSQIKSQPPIGSVQWGSASNAECIRYILDRYRLVVQQANEKKTLLFVFEHWMATEHRDYYGKPTGIIVPRDQEVWDYPPNLYLEMDLGSHDEETPFRALSAMTHITAEAERDFSHSSVYKALEFSGKILPGEIGDQTILELDRLELDEKESLKVLRVTADDYAETWNNPEARLVSQALAAGGKIVYGGMAEFRERDHKSALEKLEDERRRIERREDLVILLVWYGTIAALLSYLILR
jgi:hypothetical protein